MKTSFARITVLVLAFSNFAFAASTTTTKKKTETTTTVSSPSSSNYSGSSSGSSLNFSDWEFVTVPTVGQLTSGKACKDCSSVSLFAMGIGAHKLIKDQWQAGGEFAFSQIAKSTGSSSTTSAFTLLGIATYNLDRYIEESVFLRGGIGLFPVIKTDASGDLENKFGIMFGAGKRFRLASNISYMPEFRIVKKGDIDFGFEVYFANFAARF